MSCGCTATLGEDDPRAPMWRHIFGGLTVPIKPLYMSLEAFPGKRFLKGDAGALNGDQHRRLVDVIPTKFELAPGEVESSLKAGAEIFPILDEHITIAFCQAHSRMLGV